ncbi:hypothetical protein niasHT_018306 [Heterodera trifolii]|uniref:FCP1 homology domain-containing protein n=1 Tax=Heterodera trifolii TaxID=157864 RepID=A0ABD2KYG1_9BILA
MCNQFKFSFSPAPKGGAPLCNSCETEGISRTSATRCSVKSAPKRGRGCGFWDLSRLNRDLSKVIYIDWDPQAFQLNPENVLRIDLAELLKTIHLSDIDDVRPTLQFYSQFDNPMQEFRRRAQQMAQQEQKAKESAVLTQQNRWSNFATFGSRSRGRQGI